MNDNTSKPNFELPAMPPEGQLQDGSTPEQAMPRIEHIMQPSAPVASSQPLQPVVAAQPVDPALATPNPGQLSSGAVSSPQQAADNDLIEKEWVIKAKQIVNATKDDPYTQNRELNRFKADYLKKRYNKDIKIEGA